MLPLDRFKKYVRIDPFGCHLWIGALVQGYGKFALGRGRQLRAHRWILEQITGKPVPRELVVAHLCNVRACVNPAHLVAQTQRENILYSYQDPSRGRRGGKAPRKYRQGPPYTIPLLSPKAEARFWSKVAPVTETGCRLWTAGAPAGSGGYGRFALTSSVTVGAHRVAAQLYAGRSLRSSEVVQHSCVNRNCVAEAHLTIGTQKANIADAIRALTHNSVRQAQAKLSYEKAEIIRVRHRAGESQLSLAGEFKVSQAAIWKILNGILWKLPPRWSALEPVKKVSVWPAASGKSDWETPPEFFARVDAEYHFTVDVCATAANTKCVCFFSPEQDGLKQPWRGVCWMNPPYGRGIENWLSKARESAAEGATVVCLLPVSTSTKWWQKHVLRAGAEVSFVPGKLTFVGARYPAPFASALVVYGRENRAQET